MPLLLLYCLFSVWYPLFWARGRRSGSCYGNLPCGGGCIGHRLLARAGFASRPPDSGRWRDAASGRQSRGHKRPRSGIVQFVLPRCQRWSRIVPYKIVFHLCSYYPRLFLASVEGLRETFRLGGLSASSSCCYYRWGSPRFGGSTAGSACLPLCRTMWRHSHPPDPGPSRCGCCGSARSQAVRQGGTSVLLVCFILSDSTN